MINFTSTNRIKIYIYNSICSAPNMSTTTEGTTKPPGFEGCTGKPDGSYPDPGSSIHPSLNKMNHNILFI